MTRTEELKEQIAELERYLDMKRSIRDWHGVQDSASDIRDTEAQLAEHQRGQDVPVEGKVKYHLWVWDARDRHWKCPRCGKCTVNPSSYPDCVGPDGKAGLSPEIQDNEVRRKQVAALREIREKGGGETWDTL